MGPEWNICGGWAQGRKCYFAVRPHWQPVFSFFPPNPTPHTTAAAATLTVISPLALLNYSYCIFTFAKQETEKQQQMEQRT